jgi:hypothetical protein
LDVVVENEDFWEKREGRKDPVGKGFDLTGRRVNE